MSRFGRSAVVLAILLGGALTLPRGAVAHALLQSSDPAAGSTVASAPSIVTLTFGEAPDPSLSSVKVLDSSGRNVAAGPATAVPGQPEQLQVRLTPIGEGVYTVAWRTVSTVDGHVAAGSFAFGVGVAPTAPGGVGEQPAVSSPSASPAAVLARFLLYLGLIVLFGAGFVGAVVHPHPPRSTATLALVAWLLSAIGAVGVAAVQWSDSDVDLGTFLGSGLGSGVLGRILAAAAGGVVVGLLVLRWPRAGRALLALAAGCAGLAMLVDVLNGHAAAGGSLPAVQVAAQWVHVAAAGAWLGGLAALLLSLRGAPGDDKTVAAQRFSRWAIVGLAAVAASGVLRAVEEVGTLEALVDSDFGRLVIVKSILLGGLAILGATNHFFSVPRVPLSLRPLRRVGGVELSLGTIVLLATGVLVNLVPPSTVAAAPTAPPTAPVVTTGSDFGTTVRLRLVVTPGTPGINQFAVAVNDYDTGDPVPARGVSLRFSVASAAVGESTLPLAPGEPGAFSASGSNLSLDGIWKITAVVTSSSGSVEVPLALATSLPGQLVDVNAAPGTPTIYTAHLPAGRSVQVYLDPGASGANDLHATFFDTTGVELPVATATLLASPVGAAGEIIVPTQLEPGHFVASLQAEAGPLGVDVAGPAPDGTTLHAHVDLTIQP